MDPFLFSFEWGDRKCLLKYRFEFSRKFGSQMLKVEASSSRRKDFPPNIPPFNVFNFSRRRSQEHGRILSPIEIYETFQDFLLLSTVYDTNFYANKSKERKLGDTDFKYRDDYFSLRSSGKR